MAATYSTSLAPTAVSFLAAGEAETVAFSTGTGSNRGLLVTVLWRDRTNDITGVTYNGVAMTSLCVKTINGNAAMRFYGLANPASGTNNIVVTMGAGDLAGDGQISAWAGDGVDQTTPFDTAVTANGSGSTASIVSSATLTTGATGDRAVFFHGTYNITASITAVPTGYTERQDLDNAGGLSTEFGDADGAASITGSATWNNGAYLVNWVTLAVNVNAAAAAAVITPLTAGAWAAGTTSVAPALPTGPTSATRMFLFVGCKPYNATIVTPTGWTALAAGGGANGTTASGVDTGSVLWATFYRDWVTGDAAPTVSITSGNVALGVINGFDRATGYTWDTPVAGKGSDTTSGTGYSVTSDVNLGITTGDYVLHGTVIAGNNSTFGTPTLTATGATFGTVTESPATEGTTALGQDLEASAAYVNCTGGPSSAAPVGGWTLSVAQTGGSSVVRLRMTIASSGNRRRRVLFTV